MLARYKEAEKKKEPKELCLRRPKTAVPKIPPGPLASIRNLCLKFSGVAQEDWGPKFEELVEAYGGAEIKISKDDFAKAFEPAIQMLLQPCQLQEEETFKCFEGTSFHDIPRATAPNEVQRTSNSQLGIEEDDEIVFDFAKKKQEFERCARCCTEILQVYALCTQCLVLRRMEEEAAKKAKKKRKRNSPGEEDTPEKPGRPSVYHCYLCATNDLTLCKGTVGQSGDTADASKTHVYYMREREREGKGSLPCANGCVKSKGKKAAHCKQCQRCNFCSCGCHSTSWVMIYPETGLSEIVGKVSKFFEEQVMGYAKSEEKWDEVSNKVPADNEALCKRLCETFKEANVSNAGNRRFSYFLVFFLLHVPGLYDRLREMFEKGYLIQEEVLVYLSRLSQEVTDRQALS
jgi:hypothetical protein